MPGRHVARRDVDDGQVRGGGQHEVHIRLAVEAPRRVVQPAGLLSVGAGAQVRPHETRRGAGDRARPALARTAARVRRP